MSNLINQYVTRKGQHISFGKIKKINPADELITYEDFEGKTQSVWLAGGLKSFRKSSKTEIETARKKAEQAAQKRLVQAVEELDKAVANIEYPKTTAVKPYEITDTPLSIVNDSQTPSKTIIIEGLELETATFDAVCVHYDYTEGEKSGSYDVPDDAPEISILKVMWKGINILGAMLGTEISNLEAEILEQIKDIVF